MSSGLVRFVLAGFLVAAAAMATQAGMAQQAPAASPSAPAAQAPAASSTAPAKPAEAPSATAPTPAASGAAKPAEQAAPSGDNSTGQTVDLPAQPFVFTEGKADKDEIYGAILNSLGVVKSAMDKADLKPVGRPLAVFVQSDDSGFTYHAGYPVAAAPEGKSSLTGAVKIGQTPSGKAMRFEHDGAYSDIDATYDAITAYLDDKGIDAQDSFIEEYVNDVKDPDDPNLKVNIYVLLK